MVRHRPPNPTVTAIAIEMTITKTDTGRMTRETAIAIMADGNVPAIATTETATGVTAMTAVVTTETDIVAMSTAMIVVVTTETGTMTEDITTATIAMTATIDAQTMTAVFVVTAVIAIGAVAINLVVAAGEDVEAETVMAAVDMVDSEDEDEVVAAEEEGVVVVVEAVVLAVKINTKSLPSTSSSSRAYRVCLWTNAVPNLFVFGSISKRAVSIKRRVSRKEWRGKQRRTGTT